MTDREDAPAAIEEAGTAATVQRGRRLALAGIVCGVAALTLAIVLITSASDRQDALERDGVPVPGVVIGARHPIRGPDSVDYRYTFQGREYVGHIGGSNFYEVGEQVTVFVDAAQPGRSTLPDEQPQSGAAYWVTIFALVLGLGGVGAGIWSAHLWRRRRRILRAAPWKRRSLRLEWLSRGRWLHLVDADEGVTLAVSKQQAKRLTLPGAPEARLRIARHRQRVVVSSIDHDELAIGRVAYES